MAAEEKRSSTKLKSDDTILAENILGRLPLSDAVRTSKLSPNWRHVWKGIGRLKFDKEFLDYIGEERIVCHDMYASVVDRVLFLHNGPLHEVVLLIPSYGIDLPGPILDISPWLSFLSRTELESLTIEVCKGYSDLPGGFGGYQIPSCLFSCAGLKHLKLSSCVIEASCQVTGFSHLTRLELYRVYVSRGTLETIIGESPLLEKLSLRDCFIKEDSLLINGPELRLLDVQCPYPKELQLQRPLNVVSVTVRQMLVVQVDNSNTSNLVDFLCHLPVVEDVALDLICDNDKPFSETFTSYNIPRRLPVALENMKKLTIESLSPNEADHISYLLCLIRSSPALTTLQLRLCMFVNDVNEEITVETQGRDEASSNSLQTIKITQVRGTKHEMMLIKCLISCCMKLKTMHIIGHRLMQDGQEARMLKELVRLRRAPADADLIYTEHGEDESQIANFYLRPTGDRASSSNRISMGLLSLGIILSGNRIHIVISVKASAAQSCFIYHQGNQSSTEALKACSSLVSSSQRKMEHHGQNGLEESHGRIKVSAFVVFLLVGVCEFFAVALRSEL